MSESDTVTDPTPAPARMSPERREHLEFMCGPDGGWDETEAWQATEAAREILDELAAVEKERDACKAESAKWWKQICETVEALGLVSPEAAPYSVEHGRRISAMLSTAKAAMPTAAMAKAAAGEISRNMGLTYQVAAIIRRAFGIEPKP